MNPLMNINWFDYPVLIALLACAGWSSTGRWRRLVVVVSGMLAGCGLAASLNALLGDIFDWLARAHTLPSGSVLSTGDIYSGLVIAGGAIGLLTAMFLRSSPSPATSANAIMHEQLQPTDQAG